MSKVETARPKVIPHFTPAERAARGKAARTKVPRTLQAEIEIPKDRDAVALLEEQAATRVPELVPIRYGRMLASAFAFYRGGALIMATDLSRTPNSGIRTQLCGDAHLSNFGAFGSPERTLVFDINDFDETAPGPWEWDVKRLAASFAIAGRDNGFSQKEREAAVLATVRSYREAMTGFAAMRNLQVWYASLPMEQALQRVQRRSRPEAAEEGRGRRRQVAHARQHARLREADPPRRRRAPHHQRPASHRADRRAAPPGEESRPDRERDPRSIPRLPTLAGQRPARSARAVPLRRPGPQGGRGRERRHPRPDRPLPGRRRSGSPLPAGQGGAAVGARAVRRQERVHEPRRAGRRRAAVDAGRHRHLHRLAAHQVRRSTGRNATSTCAN